MRACTVSAINIKSIVTNKVDGTKSVVAFLTDSSWRVAQTCAGVGFWVPHAPVLRVGLFHLRRFFRWWCLSFVVVIQPDQPPPTLPHASRKIANCCASVPLAWENLKTPTRKTDAWGTLVILRSGVLRRRYAPIVRRRQEKTGRTSPGHSPEGFIETVGVA